MSDYNLRQYRLMAENIRVYRSNPPTVSRLHQLESNLQGLLLALEGVGKDWFNTFQTHCNQLEFVVAEMMYQQSETLDESSISIITETLDEMPSMIEPLLSGEDE